MKKQCCKAAAPILPGAALLLLPKCPLCLAAWLTLATGVSFSASGAAWVRWMLVALAVVAVALAGIGQTRSIRRKRPRLARP